VLGKVMIRFIISYYVVLILSLGIFVLSFVASMSLALPDPFMGGVNQKIAKGTLSLLNQQFEGLDDQQTEALLAKYRLSFGSDLSLLNDDALKHFTTAQKESLNAGELVFEVIENPTFMVNKNLSLEDDNNYSFFYLRQSQSSKVWRVNFDLDNAGSFPLPDNKDAPTAEFSSRFITGMMSVIQSTLLSYQSASRQTILQTIQKDFGLPIQLLKASSIKIDAFKGDYNKHPFSGKIKQRVYRYTEDNGDISLLQRIPDSELALKVGPFEVSWFTRHIDDMIIAAAFIALLSTFFLGIWPLWSNLIKIKKAANEFGKGNYAARVSIGKFSPIKTISKAFNAMAEQTQDSIRAQKELTSAVSHELRTPIARMHFALESLEQTNIKKEKIESIIDIKEDMAELNSLIDELLHYARYDQKKVDINPVSVNLTEWFNHTLLRLKPLANNKALNYSISSITQKEHYPMDPRLMSRVLDNLIQNALRYAQSQVQVTLSKTKKYYLITVEDDGEGIPENKRKQVFEAFSRLDSSRNRRTGGYGLGLAIVEKIITSHKGTVLISEPQKLVGACFEVRLPIKS
jgi:signal transduction histidine kinase